MGTVSLLFKHQTLSTDMRLIFVILVFLPALIYARPLDEDEPSASNEDEEKITDLPDSSEPGQGQKKEINEDDFKMMKEKLHQRDDCVDYKKKLDECLRMGPRIIGCSMPLDPSEGGCAQTEGTPVCEDKREKYRACLKWAQLDMLINIHNQQP